MVAYITDMTMQKKVMTKKKKGHQIFGQEKCTPENILATPMYTCLDWSNQGRNRKYIWGRRVTL